VPRFESLKILARRQVVVSPKFPIPIIRQTTANVDVDVVVDVEGSKVPQQTLNYACTLIFRCRRYIPIIYIYITRPSALLSHVISGTGVLDGFVECELSAQQRPRKR